MRFALWIQGVNILLIVGIIYILSYFIFVFPKKMRTNSEKLEQIELTLKEISKKLDQNK